MTTERRRRRKEIRLLQRESVWLQKALFALQKAEDVRERLAATREEEPEPYVLSVDGETMPVEALADALQQRIQELLETVRERRQNLR